MGAQGVIGPIGATGTVDPSTGIINGTTQQTANFNITGTGAIGAGLTVGVPLAGTALSTTMSTSAGTLGDTLGDELKLASIGYLSGNNTSLGVHALRSVGATGWQNTAVTLQIDVDDTPAVNNSVLALSASGNVGIGTTTPGAKLDVAGGIQTQYSGSTVLTLVPNALNTLTHNLNIPAGKTQLIFATNGDVSANLFTIPGTSEASKAANSFAFYATGGGAGLARIDWVIFVK